MPMHRKGTIYEGLRIDEHLEPIHIPNAAGADVRAGQLCGRPIAFTALCGRLEILFRLLQLG